VVGYAAAGCRRYENAGRMGKAAGALSGMPHACAAKLQHMSCPAAAEEAEEAGGGDAALIM
jgi:hypothetical protein